MLNALCTRLTRPRLSAPYHRCKLAISRQSELPATPIVSIEIESSDTHDCPIARTLDNLDVTARFTL